MKPVPPSAIGLKVSDITMVQRWPVKQAVRCYREKPRPSRVMETGVRAIGAVAGGGQRRELPFGPEVDGVGDRAAGDEQSVHLLQVVLQTVVIARQQARGERRLEHVALNSTRSPIFRPRVLSKTCT